MFHDQAVGYGNHRDKPLLHGKPWVKPKIASIWFADSCVEALHTHWNESPSEAGSSLAPVFYKSLFKGPTTVSIIYGCCVSFQHNANIYNRWSATKNVRPQLWTHLSGRKANQLLALNLHLRNHHPPTVPKFGPKNTSHLPNWTMISTANTFAKTILKKKICHCFCK